MSLTLKAPKPLQQLPALPRKMLEQAHLQEDSPSMVRILLIWRPLWRIVKLALEECQPVCLPSHQHRAETRVPRWWTTRKIYFSRIRVLEFWSCTFTSCLVCSSHSWVSLRLTSLFTWIRKPLLIWRSSSTKWWTSVVPIWHLLYCALNRCIWSLFLVRNCFRVIIP